MRRCILAPLVAIVLATVGTRLPADELPRARPEQVDMSSTKLAEVDRTLQELVDAKRLVGATVMIARRGKLAHVTSVGMMDVEANKAMRPDTIVRIYSMSKSITTAAALMLHEEGKLELDAPASKYVPELKHLKYDRDGKNALPTREVTVRDLMRHTSGMIYGSNNGSRVARLYEKVNVMDKQTDLHAMSVKLGKLPLEFEPGTSWQYGLSIDVVGHIIERVSGMPLDQFLQQRVFDPLDMRDTGFSVPKSKRSRFAANYTSNGKGKLTLRDAPQSSAYAKPATLFSGGGGLLSTARDYTRFLVMIANGGQLHGTRLLKPETVRLMTTNQVPSSVGWIRFGKQLREGVGFSLGFSVRVKMSDWDPSGRVGEYGWGGAASTHYWTSPRDNLIVVTLEQRMPYTFETEWALKKLIYDAIE